MDEPWMLDDLKAQLESLNNRVGKLERTYVQKGTELLWVRLSGHVNRAAMWAGNGHENDFFNVDNDASGSRFRIEAGKDFNQDVSVGTIIEVGAASNTIGSLTFRQQGSSTEPTVTQPSGSFTINGRKVDLFFSSKTYGTLSLGKNLTASTTAGSTDLSGTDMVLYADPGALAAGLEFQKVVSGTHTRIFQVSDAFNNYDGPGRRDRVRYDSPTFYGFIFSAAAMDGTGFRKHGNWDAALRYAQEFNKIKLAAAAGYARLERNTSTVDNNDDAWFGSASILFPQGWNFTVSGSRFHEDHRTITSGVTGGVTPDRDRYSSWYAKLGYLFNWCQWGQTALGVDYGQTRDFLFTSALGLPSYTDSSGLSAGKSRARAIGAGIVQKIDAIATELYAGYHNYRVDDTGRYTYLGTTYTDINPSNINAGMVGARIKM